MPNLFSTSVLSRLEASDHFQTKALKVAVETYSQRADKSDSLPETFDFSGLDSGGPGSQASTFVNMFTAVANARAGFGQDGTPMAATSSTSSGNVIYVSADDDVKSIITNAQSGDTIVLSEGDYDASDFFLRWREFDDGAPLTIQSAEGETATIHGTITIRDASNIAFDGIHFQTVEAENPLIKEGHDLPLAFTVRKSHAVEIADAENVTITNSVFSGYEVQNDYFIAKTYDNSAKAHLIPQEILDRHTPEEIDEMYLTLVNPAYTDENGKDKGVGGYGVVMRAADNVTLEGNTFRDLSMGVEFVQLSENLSHTAADASSNIIIKSNTFTGVQEDAIRGTDHTGTLIENNLFTKFNPLVYFPDIPEMEPKTHNDGIQYWLRASMHGVTDLTINGNVFYQADGHGLQTIFGHGRGDTLTEEATLSGFTVTNNLIYTGAIHGITLSGLDGDPDNFSVVANNTILTAPGSGLTSQIYIGGKEYPASHSLEDLEAAGYTSHVRVYENLVNTSSTPIIMRDFTSANIDPALALLNITGETDADAANASNTAFEDLNAIFGNLYADMEEVNDLLATDTTTYAGTGSALSYVDDIYEALGVIDPRAVFFMSDFDTVIKGTDAGETIHGTAGNDWIEAEDGGDVIVAGDGDDYIDAGKGSDAFIVGGNGADTFVFEFGDDILKIADWEDGTDKILLQQGLTFAEAVSVTTNQHGHTEVNFGILDGTYQRIVFTSTPGEQIGAEDFLTI